VAIALGSNLGDSLAILQAAVAQIANLDQVQVLAQSSWYQTKPIGPPQPDYFNGCITVQTDCQPVAFLHQLQTIEQHFGRIRREHWGARTLDLDIILWGDQIITEPTLMIPHCYFRDRAFVLMPLQEIAAHWIDPVTQLTIDCLYQQVDRSGIIQHLPSS